jgi:CubicO group peptidase (beta-lactamase class C family)
MKLAAIALALVFLAAQPPAFDGVDDYVRAQMKEQRIPGLALAIVRNGQVVKATGYGVGDVDNDVPVTADTVFEVASITKQFTATLIMMLVEERKLRLDDKLVTFLTDPPAAWKDITICHLLTHTGGLAPLGNDFKSAVWRTRMSTAALYEAAKQDPMGGAPGERFSYSDVGYFLLGMVIEKVTGQRYGAALSQRILQPLQMTSSRMLDQLRPLKHLARGYTLYRDPAANGVETLVNIRRVVDVELASHYGLFSTVLDLAKWDASLYTEKVLKRSSLEQMWSPARLQGGSNDGYGFGWELFQRRGHKLVGHSGITGTYLLSVPGRGLTVIVLTNLGLWGPGESRGANPQKIAFEIAEMVEPELALKPMEDRDPDVTQKVRTVFMTFGDGPVDSALVSPRVAKEFAEILEGIRRLKQRFGTLQSIELVDRYDDSRGRVFLYRMKSATMSTVFIVHVDPRGTITRFEPVD